MDSITFLTFAFNSIFYKSHHGMACPLCVAVHSLRTHHPNDDTILMHTPEVHSNELKFLNDEYRVIPKKVNNIPMPHSCKNGSFHKPNVFMKLNMWKLKQYTNILAFDADVMFVNRVSLSPCIYTYCGSPRGVQYVPHFLQRLIPSKYRSINHGVVQFSPSISVFNKLLRQLANLSGCGNGEGYEQRLYKVALENDYNNKMPIFTKDIGTFSSAFNCRSFGSWTGCGMLDLQKTAIYHWSSGSGKPWLSLHNRYEDNMWHGLHNIVLKNLQRQHLI